MALITINGVSIPTPSEYSLGILDISKLERNANGTMIGERIATKRKIEMKWNYLSKGDLTLILNSVSNLFFAVTYEDPINGQVSGTFYSGDKKCGMIDFLNGVPRYKDISFNLIER